MKFDLKNRIDIYIIFSVLLLILTGTFLRYFKFLLSPVNTEKITMFLIPETVIIFTLLTYKILKGK